MYPRRITLKNFGSFESLDYEFVHEPVAVIGENKTQDDQLSNGTGKSTLGQALFYGIYGANLRGTLDKKLIRTGYDTAYVCVKLYCPIRKQVLVIEREIRIKGSATLKINLIGEGDEAGEIPVTTILEGNRWIANWIGISAEDAKSYYIITKGNYKSFFSSSNTEKLALISRFINFSNIDKTKDVIGKRIEEINDSKQEFVNKKHNLEGQEYVYQNKIQEELSKDRSEERKQAVEKQKDLVLEKQEELNLFDEKKRVSVERIKKIDEETFRSQKAKNEVLKELQSVRSTDEFAAIYKEIDEGFQEHQQVMNEKNADLVELERYTKRISQTIKNCEIALMGVIECPKCHHRFLKDSSNESLEEIQSKKESLSKEVERNKKASASIEKELDELRDTISEYLELKNETYKEEEALLNEISSIKKKINNLDYNLDRLNSSRKMEETKIENAIHYKKVCEESIEKELEILNKLENDPIEEYDPKGDELKIKEIKKQIKKQDDEILKKDAEIFKKQQWVQRFKDFKMFLAVEQIKNIQIIANEVLQSMGSDLRLMIESLKKNSKGDLKEEITPYIFRDEIESFFYYSGGEQARCEIALILALQQMINATKQYGGLQFLLVDEVLESADSLGIEKIISSMGFLKQPSLIITHVPKVNEEIRQIKIIKENGVSHLEEVK